MTNPADLTRLEKITGLIRHYILTSTTAAGSGHPTSSLSAVELMTALFFGGIFRYDADRPHYPNNDRLVFSKGHATPLFYSLWVAAGKITGEYLEANYRKFGSPLEGHPTVKFPYVEAATGSLGQGLSVGVGLAMNARYLDMLPYRTYVLLGDSEMAEGSVWEALEIAAHYKLDNLVGIADINRLGQRGETMYGWDIESYVARVSAFGWQTLAVDGHSLPEVLAAYEQAMQVKDQPVMIIAKTIKGKGVSFIENKNGWHGKTLNKEECDRALGELGDVDLNIRGELARPEDKNPEVPRPAPVAPIDYAGEAKVATRKAYGNALARLGPGNVNIVSLDGEVSNSTMAETFAKACPDRFFEMYIAEQNMADVGLGLATRGKIPFVSTFAAFLDPGLRPDPHGPVFRPEPEIRGLPRRGVHRLGRALPRWASKTWPCSAPWGAVWWSTPPTPWPPSAWWRNWRSIKASPTCAPPGSPPPSSTARRSNSPWAAARPCATATRTGPRWSAPASPCSRPWRLTTSLRKWALPSGSSIFTASSPLPRPPWPTPPGPRATSSPWRTTTRRGASAKR